MHYEQTYARYLALVEQALAAYMPQSGALFAPRTIPATLCEAMRYSLQAGGKRLRPVLLLATADMLGGPLDEAMPYAVALELIHTCSLIHDDLPGMDNDDFRRGKPTNHRVYGEGMAILAGDGLLNAAYEHMTAHALAHPKACARHVAAMHAIARAAGVTGMIAGQAIDLACEAGTVPQDEPALAYIHANKTGAMLMAPVLAAMALCGADDAQCQAGEAYGRALGLAFQIADDLLDIEGDAAELGKATGMDAARGKLTWPGLYGVARAYDMLEEQTARACNAVALFGEKAAFLQSLARNMAVRRR